MTENDLKIELKNFYVFDRNDKKNILSGTLYAKIKLGDFFLNIRGILVFKKKERGFFRMPFKTATVR